MTYSLHQNSFFTELWLFPDVEFLVVKKDLKFLIDDYPKRLNKFGTLVNYVPTFNTHHTEIFRPLKYKRILTRAYRFKSGGFSIGKDPDINEDAYFITPSVIGVADGVGGCMGDFGISSADFANELMRNCKEYAQKLDLNDLNSSEKAIYARKLCKEIVSKAYSQVISGGSTTYLLASILGRRLHISNLGDSGLIIIRFTNSKGKIMFQTSAKQHSFNTPFQLSHQFSPKQLKRKTNHKTHDGEISDHINDADDYMISVESGDLVVMGSDGVWDNLYIEEILEIVEKNYIQNTLNPEDVAVKLATMAREKSIGGENTPFGDEVKLKMGQEWNGGKKDDITVVLSLVLSQNNLN